MTVFKRKEWLYDLRWRVTKNLVPYELEARIKIKEVERHCKVLLSALFSVDCSISTKFTKTDSPAVQSGSHILLVLMRSLLAFMRI